MKKEQIEINKLKRRIEYLEKIIEINGYDLDKTSEEQYDDFLMKWKKHTEALKQTIIMTDNDKKTVLLFYWQTFLKEQLNWETKYINQEYKPQWIDTEMFYKACFVLDEEPEFEE